MAYNALNNLIDAYIYANGVQAITGQILNGVLKQMVSQLGSGYHLMGVADPETVPASNDFAMAYFAATAGEYTDFGGITIAAGEVAVLLTFGNGSWSKQTIYNVPTGTADLENTANFITNAVTDLVNYYTKEETDTTLADYPTLEALATALADYYTKTEIDGQKAETDAALADRYTKDETDTKLADYYKKTETYDKDEVDSIVAALSRQEYIVAWNGTTTPDVSTIPAGVTVTYSGTTYTGTMAASASTVNKIYMVWNGTAYDMYGTSQDGGYSWVPMGTTTVDLSQYATKAELSQLEAKVDNIVVKPEWLEGYEDANLFHTRACKLAEQGKYVYVYGGTIAFPASASYNTYLLAVDPTKKYKFKNIRFGVPVKEDKTTPCSNTVIENATLVDMANYTDVAYIYFSFNTGDYNPANYIVSEGETLNEEITLPEWFGDWVNEFAGPQDIPDGGVTTQKLANDSVTTSKIADDSVSFDKVSFKKSASNNLINKSDADVMLGYFQAGATPTANSSYNLTGYIPVVPGKTYVFSKDGEDSQGMRFLCYFKSDKTYLSDVSTTGVYGPFVVPAQAAFVRVSIYTTAWDLAQLEEGSAITPYADYDPSTYIKPEYIPKITRSMVDDNSGFPSSPIPFASFRDSFEVQSNETKQVNGILSAKSLYLSAEIVGTIEEVIVGVGIGSAYGSGVKITPTQMFLVSGSSLSVDNTYNHGLTLGTMTKVVIHREQNDLIYVDLYDDAGNTFRGGNRNAYIGMPFVINNGTNSVNISVSQFNRDANTPILVCGDSYWSMADSRRITDNLLNYGCKGFQLYARGGIDAAGIYPSLERTIEQGAKPKYIIWDIGMNGGADSDGAVNTSWLSYTTQFLTLCDNAGITPVLCTIPSVPSQIHTKLNEWVRASGRRYIDLDSEVKAISGYYWRGWGTADALLSSDEVHPTTAGAKQLALRIMVDFPEIAVL